MVNLASLQYFSLKHSSFHTKMSGSKRKVNKLYASLLKKTFNGHSGGHADVRTTDKSLIIILLRDLFETQFLYKHKLRTINSTYFSKYLLSLCHMDEKAKNWLFEEETVALSCIIRLVFDTRGPQGLPFVHMKCTYHLALRYNFQQIFFNINVDYSVSFGLYFQGV